MKRIVYLVLKQSPEALAVLEETRKDGFNATLVATESLHHALEQLPEESHFFNLRHVEKISMQQSLLCLFVVEEKDLWLLKDTIRASTGQFTKIHGFMFSRALDDYEGSV